MSHDSLKSGNLIGLLSFPNMLTQHNQEIGPYIPDPLSRRSTWGSWHETSSQASYTTRKHRESIPTLHCNFCCLQGRPDLVELRKPVLICILAFHSFSHLTVHLRNSPNSKSSQCSAERFGISILFFVARGGIEYGNIQTHTSTAVQCALMVKNEMLRHLDIPWGIVTTRHRIELRCDHVREKGLEVREKIFSPFSYSLNTAPFSTAVKTSSKYF